MSSGKIKKVMVIGWDCASPQLVFDAYLDEMPNLKRFIESGVAGVLNSTLPPITPAAWTATAMGRPRWTWASTRCCYWMTRTSPTSRPTSPDN